VPSVSQLLRNVGLAMFELVVFAVAVLAGGVASIAGFGIGSLLTPVLATQLDMRIAVAAVALPHAAGTALRLWTLRRRVDWPVLRGFGLASAAGGLAGAVLHAVVANDALRGVFAALLIFAGVAALSGLSRRLRCSGWLAWVAGLVSGLLGGLVGNQGGIRSAALLGFQLQREAFVATATAIALIIDAARTPVYLAASGSDLLAHWRLILVATAGVLAGTLLGRRTLSRVPEPVFYRVVGGLLLVLGLYMAWSAR
jgi:hypothetical protein